MSAQEAGSFGELLRDHRRAAELTQEELAERAGLSRRTVSDLERGLYQRPHQDTVRLLAQALELDPPDRAAFASAARHSVPSGPDDASARPGAPLQIFLVADIRGYTRFTQDHGDEAAAQLAGRFAAIAREVSSAHGGEVIELRGDEALAVFDSARNALRASLALQQRLDEAADASPALPLRAGIGLDAGEAVPVEGGYRGGALNLAARLCSIAAAGEIFASDTVIGLARKTNGIAFLDRGEVTLKGLTAPVRVIQIAPEGELPDELPPLQPILVTHPTNLPDEPTPFIGREREIAQVSGLLHDPHIRMVTLTGPGGSGKTRLALQVGSSLLYNFRDGVFFVDLAPLADPALVPLAIADVLSVELAAGVPVLSSLTEALEGRQLLLVLDNFEHLLEAAPAVAELLDRCRQLHVLVTSRFPLHLAREHEHVVPPLLLPDLQRLPEVTQLSQYEAVALFIQRAKAVRDTFTVTNENAPAVAEICYRLDGLPLAIELAAARIRLFPPRALLPRLDHRLKVLTGGPRDRPTRQQTLRGAIDWSYSLLEEEEKKLFDRLSVFAGGCSFEAAEAVCDPDGELDLLDGLASLVEKSLLRQEGEDEPRFSMLETIREYAGEKLAERSESRSVRDRHLRYFLDLATQADANIHSAAQPVWCQRLEMERDNLRSALDWAEESEQVEDGMLLASSLATFWYIRGHLVEGRERLTRLVSLPVAPATTIGRAKATFRAGWLAGIQGDMDLAESWIREAMTLAGEFGREGMRLQALSCGFLGFLLNERLRPVALELDRESLRLARESGHRWAEGFAHLAMGGYYTNHAQYADAAQHYEASLAIFRQLGDPWSITGALSNLGHLSWMQGDLRAARARLEASLPILSSIGVRRDLALMYGNLGSILVSQGEVDKGSDLINESLSLGREIGSKVITGDAPARLGEADIMRGDFEAAKSHFEESLARMRTIDERAHMAMTLAYLALVAFRQDDFELARARAEEGLALARAASADQAVPCSLQVLGYLAREQGKHEQAIELLRDALDTTLRVGPRMAVPERLRDVGVLAACTGAAERAARLLGAEEALRAQMGLALDKVSSEERERAVARARAALEDGVWSEALEAGRAMSLEEAVAYALDGKLEAGRSGDGKP